ncbi:homocitrate synthase [Candidatus Sulfurimonas marisnigri]|uniref:Homocitrate synthase n=1 Tax=Candidatus Sulfurimonas marisnigri TaxID=2740405 RepID=A0A7S7RNY5_9BACT|nr:homocitrate synthase [Candidatus Sulfurimonas marisnigri]QOY53787.1 homocitrate synthase [Candidatus Sulfurimonas marisnigri]
MSIINDTTLRDGEQAPFVAFNTQEKLKIAQLLYESGADELEVGIPAMGKKEQNDIKEILALNLPIPIMTWNRATMSDLESSLECGAKAVDLSIPVSQTLIDVKFNGNKDKLFKNLEDVIKLAKDEGLFVCIGGEDSSRADSEFLKEVLSIGKSLGADRFRYCDTIGILTPMKTYENISYLSSLNLIDIEMHTHNDFGMATANSIAGIEAGAVSANTTVIGLGERAGNASFEQVLMSLKHQFNEDRNINASKLQELVQCVSVAANKPIGSSRPIVGENIFSHESGIHVNGMLKNKSAYEAFQPELVGLHRFFPIGKHSGTSTLLYHLKQSGIKPITAKVQNMLPLVREMVTNRKKVLNPQELKELYLCS